jgi:predicted secreted protein
MKTARRLLLTTLMLFAINFVFSQEQTNSDTTISKRIKKNETFTVDFQSCHSCGYRWIMDSNSDSTKLKFIATTSIKNTEHQVGGNEIESWSFKGLKKGKYQLIFVYKRPWVDKIQKKEIVNIRVK